MTVVVAFLCTDGVVVGADSMLTPKIGTINVGHHKGRKVYVLDGPQLFAYAGDIGLGARFRILAEANAGQINNVANPLDYALAISQHLTKQFTATGIGINVDHQTVLAFPHGEEPQCCAFLSQVQPWLLDQDHFYVALGSGKLSADPFLRFLHDVFCQGQQPTVREAVFLATWAVQYVIETTAGGVAEPIRMGVLERNSSGEFTARELPDDEIQEPLQAVESAVKALRDWQEGIQSGKAAEDVPPPPEPPAGGNTEL